MNIETKFDIGDTIWCGGESFEIVKGTVCYINVCIEKWKPNSVYYGIVYNNKFTLYREKECFRTFDEVMEYQKSDIKIDKITMTDLSYELPVLHEEWEVKTDVEMFNGEDVALELQRRDKLKKNKKRLNNEKIKIIGDLPMFDVCDGFVGFMY